MNIPTKDGGFYLIKSGNWWAIWQRRGQRFYCVARHNCHYPSRESYTEESLWSDGWVELTPELKAEYL